MASTFPNGGETWRDDTQAFAVCCTQGALGEWFTLVPGTARHAQALRHRGVETGVPLSWADVRRQLRELGLTSAAIDRAVDQARRSATTITVLSPRASIFRRLVVGVRDWRRAAAAL